MLIPSVTRLVLTSFRGYDSLDVRVPPGHVVITGANGAGKTNLLEALSLLAPGRGLRRARFSEMGQRDVSLPAGEVSGPGPLWAVAAELELADGPLSIGTGRDPKKPEAERRIVHIAGELQKTQSSLSSFISVLWLTPQMDRLFQDGASGRRRFLDRLVFGLDPAHAGRVNSYEQMMRERSRLLREGSRDAEWLSALEHGMAEKGCAIAAARRDLVMRLVASDRQREQFADKKGSGEASLPEQQAFPTLDLALDGLVEAWLEDSPALEVEERFRRHLARNRGRDAAAGAAIDGPHRTDLKVWHRQARQEAASCSTGEQKALLVAIILANALLQSRLNGQPPLLLLDEVAAHLDAERRAALCSALEGLGGQVWMTGTDVWLFDAWQGKATFLSLENARFVSGSKAAQPGRQS